MIAACHQVLCITHLPQIAAMADQHFLIEKTIDQNITKTRIFPLEESKISVLISSFSANTDLIASIILDSSPPDATQDNGCFGSPGLVERINSASSYPFAVKFFVLTKVISNATSKKFKSIKAFLICSVNFCAFSFRISERFLHFCSEVYQSIAGDGDCVSDIIGRDVRLMNKASEYDKTLLEYANELSELEQLIQDFSRQIADYLDDFENSEEEFLRVQERLDQINQLKSRYGGSIDEIKNYAKEAAKRLERLQNHEEYMEQLKQKLYSTEKELEQKCKNLSDIRKADTQSPSPAID